jgi:hypothetical protein
MVPADWQLKSWILCNLDMHPRRHRADRSASNDSCKLWARLRAIGQDQNRLAPPGTKARKELSCARPALSARVCSERRMTPGCKSTWLIKCPSESPGMSEKGKSRRHQGCVSTGPQKRWQPSGQNPWPKWPFFLLPTSIHPQGNWAQPVTRSLSDPRKNHTVCHANLPPSFVSTNCLPNRETFKRNGDNWNFT